MDSVSMPTDGTMTIHLAEEALVQEYNNNLRNAVLPVIVLFGVEIVFGTIGNLLTLNVFTFHYKPCNFRYFVLCLALIDLICCITTIPGEMVSLVFWYAYPVPPVCKIKAFFNQFTVCSEAACLTIIAVDRYRKICQPFGWQISQKVAIYLCAGILFVASLLAIPTPIFWGVHKQTVTYKNRNITVTVCETDEKYRHTRFPLVNIVFNQSLVFISLITMVVLYVLVARKLIIGHHEIRRRIAEHKGDFSETMADFDSSASVDDIVTTTRITDKPVPAFISDSGQKDTPVAPVVGRKKGNRDSLATMVRARRKTMIMFYLTIIFVVTTVMYGALLSIVARGILSSLTDAQKAVYFFFLRLYFTNHVINPVLYGLMDPQFRTEMKRLKKTLLDFCCQKFRSCRSA